MTAKQQLVDDEFKQKISLMSQKELKDFIKDLERQMKEYDEKLKQINELILMNQTLIECKNRREVSLKNCVLESMKYDEKYNDNWIIDSFDENRKKKIVKYVWYLLHKNEKIEHIEDIYEKVLYDLTQKDVKSYGV